MKKAYIHIGTHKTGTSSIQSIFKVHNYLLSNQNIHYFHFPLELSKKLMCIEELDWSLVKKLKKSLRSYQKNKDLLLSHEGFSGSVNIGYKNSAIIAETLYHVFNNFKVIPILFLRRQDVFIESLYIQKIKQGEYISFENYVNSLPLDYFNYNQLINNYIRFFKKDQCIIRIYDSNPNKIVTEFSKILNIKFSLTNKNIINNKGYSYEALTIAKNLNKFINNDEQKKLRTILQNFIPRLSNKPIHLFKLQDRIKFLKRFSDSNSIVANKYFGKKELFHFEISDYKNAQTDSFKIENCIHLIQTLLENKPLIKKNKLKKFYPYIYKHPKLFILLRKIKKSLIFTQTHKP